MRPDPNGTRPCAEALERRWLLSGRAPDLADIVGQYDGQGVASFQPPRTHPASSDSVSLTVAERSGNSIQGFLTDNFGGLSAVVGSLRARRISLHTAKAGASESRAWLAGRFSSDGATVSARLREFSHSGRTALRWHLDVSFMRVTAAGANSQPPVLEPPPAVGRINLVGRYTGSASGTFQSDPSAQAVQFRRRKR